jgi:hypothetical protein
MRLIPSQEPSRAMVPAAFLNPAGAWVSARVRGPRRNGDWLRVLEVPVPVSSGAEFSRCLSPFRRGPQRKRDRHLGSRRASPPLVAASRCFLGLTQVTLPPTWTVSRCLTASQPGTKLISSYRVKSNANGGRVAFPPSVSGAAIVLERLRGNQGHAAEEVWSQSQESLPVLHP